MSKQTSGTYLLHNSYLVVGDVHGCYDEMVEMIDTHAENRHVVFVGDLVDKGPRSHRCLELAKLLSATVVLGNHEENHVRYAGHEELRRKTGKKNPMQRDEAFKAQHRKICASSLDLVRFMRSFPHYAVLSSYRGESAVVLHGGLLPGRTPESMNPKKIVRVRNVHLDGTFANLDECEADPSLPFWTEKYTRGTWILFGHAPFMNVRIRNRTVALDTGCVYGNRLTALKFPEMELVSVDARKAYQQKVRWDDA